jgi:thiol:disulfide interchange protein DsbG
MNRMTSLKNLFATLLLLGLTLVATPGHADDRAATLLGKMGQATSISEGNGPHLIYVFFDPNCPYCHKLYEELRPYVKTGGLEVRWVPVGILTRTSLGKAAAILEAKSPIQAFYKNEDDWNFGDTPNGGIEPLPKPAESAVFKLNANAALLNEAGISGVPVTVFRGDDGKAYFFTGARDAGRLAAIIKHVR